MTDERVIDGVLHRLEGKAYVPLTAEELTARLLEARRILDAAPKYAPNPPGRVSSYRYQGGSVFAPNGPVPTYYYPGDGFRNPTAADVPIPGVTITCDNGTRQ